MTVGRRRAIVHLTDDFRDFDRVMAVNLTGPFLCTERNHIMVAEAEKFRYVTPHHNAPQRYWQCRDECDGAPSRRR